MKRLSVYRGAAISLPSLFTLGCGNSGVHAGAAGDAGNASGGGTETSALHGGAGNNGATSGASTSANTGGLAFGGSAGAASSNTAGMTANGGSAASGGASANGGVAGANGGAGRVGTSGSTGGSAATNGGSASRGGSNAGGATSSAGSPATAGTGNVLDGACNGKVRVGDVGASYDATLSDPAYPEGAEWAKAGVQGGIPSLSEVTATVDAGATLDAIQATIDAAAQSLAGNAPRPGAFKVVLLKNGRYELDGGNKNPILSVKPGVVLRGESRDGVVLSFTTSLSDPEYDFSIGLSLWAGLENLTVTNQFVEQQAENTYLEGQASNVFFNVNGQPPQVQGKGSMLSGVRLGTNTWMQGCHLVKIGTHPLYMGGSHNTTRDNFVEKAYNKADGGRGYYYIGNGSSYNLVYHELVQHIRHITLISKTHHNVILNINMTVDINYHDGAPLVANLVEGVNSHIGGSHPWGKGDAWGFGVYHADLTADDRNLIYRLSTLPAYPVTKAYFPIRSVGGNSFSFQEAANPKANTLYPVNACREPAPM